MIHLLLHELKEELEDYLDNLIDIVDPETASEPVKVVKNIVDQDGKIDKNLKDRVLIILVDVEREGHPNTKATEGTPEYVNVFVLFVCNVGDIEDGILSAQVLSGIISYFKNNPNVSINGKTIRAEMAKLNFDEQNKLWGFLGAKYIPSVLYKFRTLEVDEDSVDEDVNLIG